MRGVCVNSSGTSTKVLAELNHHVRKEEKEVRDGVTGGGHGLSKEDESKINDDVDANQRPRPQGSVVCWKRFLPFGSLKVLLVEFDDATRHVVSALLRNCSYEVTAVANGIEAWTILQDLTIHIDLVLTEVVMPGLSGIGLLNKIINHKTCRNIPVIMMSSNDSMSMVFKCFSKGAADFLVKPIRKNELKTLWQHVWRKCHSSSGSGSESGTRTQKTPKSKNIEGTGNNNVSNDEDEIASISLNDRNGSDKGSGTQSSWTKRAIEVDSPPPMSPLDELADAPDSTCAQVVHLTVEAFSNNQMARTTKGALRGNNELGDIAMGKDLVIGASRTERQIEDQSKEVFLSISEAQERKNLETKIENDGAKLEKEKMQLNGDTLNENSRKGVADLIGMINSANPQMDGVAGESPCDITKTNTEEGPQDPHKVPFLELSLKRLRDVGEVEDPAHGQNVLRRSHLSAFSRYNTLSTANQAPIGNVGSGSSNDNNSEAEKHENPQSNSNGTPNQRSNGSSNNNDVGSTTNNAFAKSACSDKLVQNTASKIQPSSDFQPLRNGHTAPPQPSVPSNGNLVTVNTVVAQANGISSQFQVQHHHHHYHHHHHHVQNMQQQKKTPTGLNIPVEVNAANYSLKESGGSGSNNGSNGQNGSSTTLCTDVANIGSGNILAANFGAGAGWGSGSGSGSGSGVDQSRHALRMTALNKFRQKRKERCFTKKVRYQSRKKLAEQRPRVRGQFVRKESDS